MKVAKNISTKRAELTPEVIRTYIHNLSKTLEGIDDDDIVNMDESGFNSFIGQRRRIFGKGQRNPERIMNEGKESRTVVFAGTRKELLPCMILFRAKTVAPWWTTSGPSKAVYYSNERGWMNGAAMEEWIVKILIPFQKQRNKPIALICDNLSSHLSPRTVQLCVDNQIRCAFLPPNSTFCTQVKAKF